MSDLDQRRRTVRVLELLSGSFEAHERGDMAETDRLMTEAAELDVTVMSAIQGGIIIGQIPNPERDWPLWVEYVQASRDALAEAEADDEAWAGRPPSASYEAWVAGGQEGGSDG